MKRLLKKLVPGPVLDGYHHLLAKAAAFRYGHPSEKMIVIGVTGTNGKSTTCNLIARVLEGAGYKVGMTTTVNFRVAGREWLNDTKMTMLGGFRLQKLMADMVAAGCRYAVIETSSEGIKQHRHAGINYDVVVFTNLTPEHIESHGGFENYKKAKGELFAKLSKDRTKTIDGAAVKKISVVNLDDPHAGYFLEFEANKKFGFMIEGNPRAEGAQRHATWPIALVKAMNVELTSVGTRFAVRDLPFRLSLLGMFNVENAMAVVAVGLSQGIELPTMAAALEKIPGVPGRLEFIDIGQPFGALVDYAPEPESFRKLYDVIKMMHVQGKVIHVLGSTGGGRDVARRPVLGRLAAEKADVVIITNEDPYDDDPTTIIDDVAEGAKQGGKHLGQDLFAVLDRGEAIEKAVSLAEPGDLVVVTGKGAEQAICVANGDKVPWDDRVKLREAIAAKIKK